MPTYKKIGLGGTFDHFHLGHQAFLLFASELAEHLVIGITTPEMIKHKHYFSQIESYETRAEAVKSFTKNFFNKVDVIPLTDPYGPTLLGSNVEALAATSATKSGAENVNIKRAELGLGQLPIHVRELENDENGNPLASERIRKGLINRKGKVYKNIFKNVIFLNDNQKQIFTSPQGKIVTHPSPSEIAYVVGDTSLENFIAHNWPYNLGVIDFIKRRKPYQPPVLSETSTIVRVANENGTISVKMIEALANAIETSAKHLIVDGEEDLAAVALVLLAPLGTHIYYGQPKIGMVDMIVTEEKKEEVANVLRATS